MNKLDKSFLIMRMMLARELLVAWERFTYKQVAAMSDGEVEAEINKPVLNVMKAFLDGKAPTQ